MPLVDLTLPMPLREKEQETARLEERPIGHGGVSYTGMVYRFRHGSMAGTYLDFPGHIKETDDGLDAENYPLEKLYRVDSAVLHLDRASGSGAVDAEALARACPESAPGGSRGGGLVINALGQRRFDEIDFRSVFLTLDAVAWIAARGVHLLVSDIYESKPQLQGVFYELFKQGVATVCQPVRLHELNAPRVQLSALPLRFPRVTQLPCRLLAEWVE